MTSSSLTTFLSQNKALKGTAFTHTSLGEQKGRYYIPFDKMDKFKQLYKKAMNDGEEINITEKHRDICPVLIDFDFRFKKEDVERRYTNTMVETLIKKYIDTVSQYVEMPENVEAYVMEKSKPVYDEQKDVVKDGFHIVLPNVVSRPSVQFLVREDMLNDVDVLLKKTNVNNINETADVFDEAVIYKNNWFMYGSCKPGKEPYKITHHWTFNNGEKIENEILDDHIEYVDTLSIRNKYNENNIKPEHKDKITALDVEMHKKEQAKEDVKNKVNKQILNDEESNFKPTCKDIELVKSLVNLLDKKRADNYNDWIQLGWLLRNIEIGLLDMWDEFSKQSNKYQPGCCDAI